MLPEENKDKNTGLAPGSNKNNHEPLASSDLFDFFRDELGLNLAEQIVTFIDEVNSEVYERKDISIRLYQFFEQLRALRKFKIALSLVQMADENLKWVTGQLLFRKYKIAFLGLNRHFEEALDELRRLLPQIKEPDEELGFIYLQARFNEALDRKKIAINLLLKSVQHEAIQPNMLYRLSRLAFEEERYGIANKAIQKKIKLFGGNITVFLKAALYAYKAKDLENGYYMSKYVIDYIKEFPEETTVEFRRSVYELYFSVLFDQRRYPYVCNHLSKYLQTDTSWQKGIEILFQCYLEQNQTQKAEALIADLECLKDSLEVTLVSRHKLLTRQGKASDAIEVLQELEVSGFNNEYVQKIKLTEQETKEKLEQQLHSNFPHEFTPQWTRNDIVENASFFKGLKHHLTSMEAFILREMRAKYGRRSLGFLWMFLEPMVQTLLLILVFTVLSKSTIYGMPVALFIVTGLIPFNAFSSIFGQTIGSVKGNRPLFMHPRVNIIDIIFAKTAMEALTHVTVFLIFVCVIAFIYDDVFFEGILYTLYGFFCLLSFGLGLGLIAAAIDSVMPSIATIINYGTRLLFFTSGVFFAPEMFSGTVKDIMLLNPLLHYISMIRNSFTPVLSFETVDMAYASMWALCMLCAGFTFERVFRYRQLSQ